MTPSRDPDRDLDLELRFHLEESIAELRRQGLSPEEAAREAARRFGDSDRWRERIRLSDRRHARVIPGARDMMAGLLSTGRRVVRRDPGYAAAFVVSLALGLAVTCTALAFVKRAFLDPLPYPDSDRLVTIRTVIDGQPGIGSSLLVGDDLRASGIFSQVSGDWGRNATYEVSGASERVAGSAVSAAYFQVLGVQPAIGTTFSPDATDEVIVSWSFYQRALAGNPAAIGAPIALDGVPTRVVGVMPPHFVAPFLSEAELWFPLDERPLRVEAARAQGAVVLHARLAPGVSLREAQAFLEVFTEQQHQRYPALARMTWDVNRLQTVLVASSRTLLVASMGATALLMTIVLANIAGLSAARAGERRRADAVRMALGASGVRLLGERAAESLVLAGAGTGVGLWLTSLLITWAAAYQQQFQLFLEDIPVAALDTGVAAAGVLLGLTAALVSALVPFRAAHGLQPGELAGAGRGGAAGHLARTRSTLVVVQVTVALVLLVAAGLLVRTIEQIRSTSPGFDTGDVVTFGVSLPASRYADAPRRAAFEAELLERVRHIEGVSEATAMATSFPTTFAPRTRVAVAGQPPDVNAVASLFLVAPDALSVLRIPLRAGRMLEGTDRAEAPAVALVSETMANRTWPSGDVLGARLRVGVGSPAERDVTVVGVVGDIRQDGPTRDVMPTVYLPSAQQATSFRTFVLRSQRPDLALRADLRAAVEALDALLPPPVPQRLDRRLDRLIVQQRFAMSLLTMFGACAAGLCALGLYVVVTMTAQARRREFALRMAIGAAPRDVSWLVLRQALWLVAVGGVAGIGVAVLLARSLRTLLVGVDPTDWRSIAAALATVVVIAVVAAVRPAWRSTRIDPVVVLK